VEHSTFLRALDEHCEGLRWAALAAGPDAPVPTCPNWTVGKLVRHHARVQSWARAAIEDPTGRRARPGKPPEGWNELVAWWDERRRDLREMLASDPGADAWLPFPDYPPTTGSWARRQAHEAAIHRIDVELALGAATVTFESEFAADGIDELLTMVLPARVDWSGFTVEGDVLVHAEDAGRLWSVRIAPGQAPRLTDPEQPSEADLTIEGDADAVYRAVWGRPNRAVVSGDSALLAPLAAP
jgi:uncharacterized protein (TIGR03083 family)